MTLTTYVDGLEHVIELDVDAPCAGRRRGHPDRWTQGSSGSFTVLGVEVEGEPMPEDEAAGWVAANVDVWELLEDAAEAARYDNY